MRKIVPYRYGRIQRDDVNQLARENYFALVQQSEQFYMEQLDNIADEVDKKKSLQIVCLAGPSSSGKTTTAHMLRQKFCAKGRNCRVISLDDFYLPVEKTPRNEDGTPDFESVDALEVSLINLCVKELLENGKTMVPEFDFHTHARKAKWQEIICEESDIIIFEGLHALNPRLTSLVSEDYITRIYVSARSKFVDGETEILSPKDIRLMRRMVRDVAKRNTQPEETIDSWNKVCNGERKHIDPYRDGADFKIDSTMEYEPCIFRTYLEPFMCRAIIMDEDKRQILVELWNKLAGFLEIQDASVIPKNSVIREFIGND